jgi:hypothetical protein
VTAGERLRLRPEPNRAAHASGNVKTAQDAAMQRNGCSPSGTSGAVVSAATATEISTDRPSGRHNPSSRLTRLTAGPIAVTSSRSAAPRLPHRISPRCSAAPKGSGGSPAPAAPHRSGPCRRGRRRPRAAPARRPRLARQRPGPETGSKNIRAGWQGGKLSHERPVSARNSHPLEHCVFRLGQRTQCGLTA